MGENSPNPLAVAKQKRRSRLDRMRQQCPVKTYRNPEPLPEPLASRPVMFRRVMEETKKTVKNQHGHGVYSWTEGVRRKNARRIALRIARRAFRELREKIQSKQQQEPETSQEE